MCKEMILSLDSEAFDSLKKDFDSLLNRTIGNMEMRGAVEATITMKVGVSLEKLVNNGRDVTKPTFKHEINSVMQVKDKVTGQIRGNYRMEWDPEEQRYVLKDGDEDQMNMFDGNPGVADAEWFDVEEGDTETSNEPKALPAPVPALPGEVEDGYEYEDAEEESDEDGTDYTEDVETEEVPEFDEMDASVTDDFGYEAPEE